MIFGLKEMTDHNGNNLEFIKLDNLFDYVINSFSHNCLSINKLVDDLRYFDDDFKKWFIAPKYYKKEFKIMLEKLDKENRFIEESSINMKNLNEISFNTVFNFVKTIEKWEMQKYIEKVYNAYEYFIFVDITEENIITVKWDAYNNDGWFNVNPEFFSKSVDARIKIYLEEKKKRYELSKIKKIDKENKEKYEKYLELKEYFKNKILDEKENEIKNME